MTKLLEQAFQKASKLPQEEQDAMAAFMIEELEHKNWLSAAGVSLSVPMVRRSLTTPVRESP